MERAPTGEVNERFATVITSHVKPLQRDKPVPSYRTVFNGTRAAIEPLKFDYAELNLSRHHAIRTDTALDQLRKEKKLFKGYWRKSQWAGHTMLEKLARSWLNDSLVNDCRTWDVHMAQLLSVVLVSASNCRCGDIARANHCFGEEFMIWQDVDMRLEKGQSVEHLVVQVTLRSMKGRK